MKIGFSLKVLKHKGRVGNGREQMNLEQKKSVHVKILNEDGAGHFSWFRSIILKHWIPHGLTNTAAYHITILKELRWKIARKRPELWDNNIFLLFHSTTMRWHILGSRLGNFWSKHSSLWWNIIHIRQISHRTTFSLTPRLKKC